MKKNFLLGILFILAGGFTFGLYFVLFSSNLKQDVKIVVNPDTNVDSLYTRLKPYMDFPAGFKIAAHIKRFQKPVPGLYRLPKNLSNNDLINILRSGRQEEIKVTFNNIIDLEHLAGRLAQYLAPDSLAFLKAMKNPENIKKYGFNEQTALLMYIPNTYRFYYNTSPEAFMQRMYKEYRKFWNQNRLAQAEEIGLSPIEAGILASIVQKETTRKEEMPRIAGVYLNRLKKGMLLQADPTVVFAYKRQSGDTATIKRVLNIHIETDDPYNTYKYPGLPPGPITMPDIQAIDAVLRAENHNYYYFVADPQRPGYHLFSRTLSEHNQKARNYRQYLNKLKVYK